MPDDIRTLLYIVVTFKETLYMYLSVETMMKYFLSDFGDTWNFSNIMP